MLMIFIQTPLSYASTENKTITDTNLSLAYPIVYTTNAKSQDLINTDIAKIVYDMKDRYDSGEYYSAELKYDISYEDDNTISILMKSTINPGGYRPFCFKEGIVYNKHTGEKLPLSNYVHIKSADQIQASLFNGLAHEYNWEMTEIFCYRTNNPVKTISTNYYLKDNGVLSLLYPVGELSCMADGIVTIVFPEKTIDYFNRIYKN